MTGRLPEPVHAGALQITEDLVEAGARATVVVGSRATGEAGPEADLDILAIGPDSYSWKLHRHSGLLVSVSSKSFEEHRKTFALPEEVCAAVPGWRGAVILHDPEGRATAVVREAGEWTWAPLEQRCDEWVAEELTGFAEEVHKLVEALADGHGPSAAVQRSLLALRLAPILAVHRRILYGSENRLWELVSDAMGEGWRRTQSAALGLDGEPLRETCTASLRLYGIAAEEVWHLLDERQKAVVGHARELAGRRGLG